MTHPPHSNDQSQSPQEMAGISITDADADAHHVHISPSSSATAIGKRKDRGDERDSDEGSTLKNQGVAQPLTLHSPTSARKRKDRDEDSAVPIGNTSDGAQAAQVDAGSISSTSGSIPQILASNTDEQHTPKKLRLYVEEPSSQITPPSDSDCILNDNLTSNAPCADVPLSTFEAKPASLLTLPLELLAEILILTGSPQHILATARSCKVLCHTLLSPSSEFIWREARKGPGCTFTIEKSSSLPSSGNNPQTSIVSLPDPPKQFFGEAAYAAFVFDSGRCEDCQKETSLLYRSFALRFRLCKKKTCTSLSSLIQSHHYLTSATYPSVTNIIPVSEVANVRDKDSMHPGPMWPRTLSSYYRPAALAEATAFNANKASPDYDQEYQRRKKRNDEWMAFCVKVSKWSRARTLTYKLNVKTNDTATKLMASNYGWERAELLNTAFGTYLRHKNKVIEKINEIDVKAMKDEIESRLLSLTEKRDRRHTEVALMNHRGDVEKAYNTIRSTKVYPYLPSLPTFRKLPVVAMLQSAESPSTAGTVSESLLTDKTVKDLLSSQLKKWVNEAKGDLGAILGFPRNWKNASKNVLHPVERVTARFLCTKCQRFDVKYRSDESLDFSGACLHECGVGNVKSERLRKGKKSAWESKNFVKDDKAVKVLKKAVDALGFAEDRDGGNYLLQVGFALVCTSCDPPMVLDSRSIIGHSHRHDDMQCSFTTPLDVIVGYLGGYPYEYGLVQKLLFVPTPPSATIKQEIDKKNYGCRHCLREKQATEAASTANNEPTANDIAHTTASATALAPPMNATSSVTKGPQIQLSSLVYRPHELGVEGPPNMPPQLFNFNGMRSHLKAKHGIENIRDEDIFAHAHPELDN